MPSWICPKCGGGVSSAFERNLSILASEHKALCPLRDAPKEHLRLTVLDEQFLRAVGIAR